jgi:hypothetical protein
VERLQKREIRLAGTILGACMSGCKMWVAEDGYRPGDPVILVRARDNAFKFDTRTAGRKVFLTGIAVPGYVDTCATEASKEKKPENRPGCAPPFRTGEKEASAKGGVESVTFFATSVQYL